MQGIRDQRSEGESHKYVLREQEHQEVVHVPLAVITHGQPNLDREG